MLLVGPAVVATWPTTEILDPGAPQALVGAHRFGLQWISWTQFGEATVTVDNAGFPKLWYPTRGC